MVEAFEVPRKTVTDRSVEEGVPRDQELAGNKTARIRRVPRRMDDPDLGSVESSALLPQV